MEVRNQEILKQRIVRLYRQKALEHWPRERFLQALNERVYRQKEYKTLPEYRKSYLRGYMDCLHDTHWQNHLYTGYVWKGKVYQRWNTFPKALKDAVRAGNGPKWEVFYKGSMDRY